MQDLTLSLIQPDIFWQDVGANLSHYEELIWKLEGTPDVIVLPEMFQTGFTMEAEGVAEPMNLTTFRWMKQMAAQTQALLLGSFIVKEAGAYYNRLLWMEPDGTYATYDKRHLFRMADEHETFSPGRSRLVGTWRGWRLMPLVCYDLRFPVWSRNQGKGGAGTPEYDVLLYVANWPAARVNAWDALLCARAIENLSYAVGVNRVGPDGKGIDYNGHSGIYDPRGECLWFGGEAVTHTTYTLSAERLHSFREKFPAYLDADGFEIKL